MALKQHPVAVIVFAQLFGTSLWFSPNSAAADLMRAWQLSAPQLGYLTSAVQLGFIAGTLLLAASGLADRFAASRIFALSCLLGALLNAAFALAAHGLEQALAIRFLVGITLAGIYPLGMKMVISWTRGHSGLTLGMLVAMLTLGTALPHAIRALSADLPWQGVILTSSVLALVGGISCLTLGDGPYLARASRHAPMPWGAALRVFADQNFRACAIGYFGHIWELYAFWTIVPFLIGDAARQSGVGATGPTHLISGWSALVIGIGAVGCVWAGRLSQSFGSPRVAMAALAASGLMCLVYPWLAHAGFAVCIAALLIWGIAVIADSAQYSATSASLCPPGLIGSALAIQNSIGYLITVVSISLVTAHIGDLANHVAWLLLPGPVVGLVFLRRLVHLDSGA